MSDNNSTANTIPAEWTKTLQGEICRLGNGEKSQVAGFPYFEVKYLRGQKPKTLVNEGRFVLKDNKVIIVDGENSGEVFTIPENGYMGSTCKVLEINPKIDEKFLLYFIASKKQLYRNKKKGSAIPHLDKKLFAEMPFAYPKLLSEQQRIVAKIEELFSKLDAGIESLKKAKQQLAVYRQAVLKEAFEQSGKKKKISEVSEFVTSGSRGWAKYYTKKKGVRFVRITDLTRDGIVIQNGNIQYLDLPNNVEGKRSLLMPADVLVSITADLGSIALVPDNIGEAYINQHIAMIRFSNRNQSKCMAYYLKSDYGQKDLLRNKRGGGKLGLGLDDIRNTQVPIFSNEIAMAIVRNIESRLSVCDQIECTVNESLEKADVLRQSILKKAFEGGL
ncbi:MAG: restriction endonuclease subunit S [Treponema sp.]|uniref:restriction endonuclease subunit S n=1 Tax=Treponema sp. TaxID=166 RepID=UPI002A91CB3C|nr:restriction endonuclease subunit S [Treponema sp.]MDY6397998.1 restriction endonuclease subunit S [Treponema sp.]